MVFTDVAVGPTCQSAGPTCQPPTLSFLSSSLSAAFLCSGTTGAALPPQASSASAHRRHVPALRPQRAGHGGGGWQAAAAWSRVRPWRLLLEGTADEVVAGDKALNEEDQRGEMHQVTRSAGSERAGGELATTGRRRPWRRGDAKCALVKPAVNTTQRTLPRGRLVDTEAGDRVSQVMWVGGVERLEVVGDESMRRATSREERVGLAVLSAR